MTHAVTNSQATHSAGNQLHGTPVVAGVGYAKAVWPGPRPELPGTEAPPADRDAESRRFNDAAAVVASRLRDRAAATTGVASEVLSATATMAADRGWASMVEKNIQAGVAAPNATVVATAHFSTMFTNLGGLMAERVTDLLDVRDRVLAELAGEPEPGLTLPDHDVIVLADDLAPADASMLDPSVVKGLATRLGGPTSHTAIIARQLGIPCVVAMADLGSITSGTDVLIDGAAGTVLVDPDPEISRARAESAAHAAEYIAQWRGPGRTADGVSVSIVANVQDGASARAATEHPVQGIGLFRTELAFLDRASEPSITEQTDMYTQAIEAFTGVDPEAKIVFRTLDAGSDKPLAFADQGVEPNPAMGVRGIRTAVANPALLENQLDAIAAAGKRCGSTPWVMAPMVATIDEASIFAAQVHQRGLIAGVMVEVPSVALLARELLDEVDFVSIGTNDLTQYVMAADRMSPELASLTDPWQPAVLRLVERVGAAGMSTGKSVGVCGEAAADPLLACVLVGLGVRSLSSAPTAAAAVGSQLESVTLAGCQAAAAAAIDARSPSQARANAAEALAAH